MNLKHARHLPTQDLGNEGTTTKVRCTVRITLGLFLATLSLLSSLQAQPMEYEIVKQLAAERAAKPYQPYVRPPDSMLEDLDYDSYRAVNFRPEKTIWNDRASQFQVQLFHMGHFFKSPLQMNLISKNEALRLPTDGGWFDYSRCHADFSNYKPEGFAGFRILTPYVNQNGRWDELGSFLGASYFRLLGEGQSYGLSARGLAIDCAHPSNQEEFPDFVEHWITEPDPCDESVRIYSLMDSPTVSGAYSFVIQPGKTTIADVEVSLYFRKDVERLGLAPLTSMHWIGKSSERVFHEYRPEVHDSDGLFMQLASGEKLWRPLVNSNQMRTAIFEANNIRTFGLMQRERNFERYQDLWNPYQNTPSLLIEPKGDWGNGNLWLIEFPTNREIDDNIVAFWEPKEKPKAGDELHYAYRMNWAKKQENKFSPNRAIATRTGAGQDFGKNSAEAEAERVFMIDFDGPSLKWNPDAEDETAEAPVPVVTSHPEGLVTGAFCTRNPYDKSWRVAFRMDTAKLVGSSSAELRCFLKRGDDVVSETWSYLWSPN